MFPTISARRPASCPPLLFAVTVALALGACDSAAGSGDSFVRSDSAGIQVAESHAPAWSEADAWTLAAEPDLEIGVIDGDARYQFSNVVGVLQLPDGRIAVGDSRAPEGTIRIFGADGEFLNSLGPQGEGPGEIRTLRWIGAYTGDSIAAWDSGNLRFFVMDPDGTARSVRMELTPPEPPSFSGEIVVQQLGAILGTFSDGTLLVSPTTMLGVNFGDRIRPPLPLHRTGPGEALGERLLSVPWHRVDVPENPMAGPRVPSPFPERTVVAVRGDRILLGGVEPGYEVHVLAPDGSLEGIIRRPGLDRSVTREIRETWREERREGMGADVDPAEFERALGETRFPDSRPPFDELLVADDGTLWLRDYPLPGDGSREWQVFDADGRHLGQVRTPARFRVHQVGPDFVLGVRTDDFDVPYVQRYELLRP